MWVTPGTRASAYSSASRTSMTAAARSRSSASSCTSISGISIGARLPVPDVTPATPAKGWAAALLGHAAVAGGGSPTGTVVRNRRGEVGRSEEHTSELQSLMRSPYAVFCLTTNSNTSTYQPTQHNYTIQHMY